MRMFRRFMIYCMGIFIVAMAIVLSVKSNLGVSPITSMPYILSSILNVDLGYITVVVNIGYVFVQILIMRGNYQMKNLLQVVFAVIFGWFISISTSLLTFQIADDYWLRFLLLGTSILLFAVGTMFIISADIVPLPAEGTMLAICTKIKMKFPNMKIVFDSSVVLIACVLSMVFMKHINGVGEGTIITALFVGKALGTVSKCFKPYVMEFCHGKLLVENGMQQNSI